MPCIRIKVSSKGVLSDGYRTVGSPGWFGNSNGGCDDLIETIGINTRVHLAEAESAMRDRINRAHMLNGVTLMDPAVTYIEADVRIGRDTVILRTPLFREPR